MNFYFGVLRPVVCTLSRFSEEPSRATAPQGVYFTFYIFFPLYIMKAETGMAYIMLALREVSQWTKDSVFLVMTLCIMVVYHCFRRSRDLHLWGRR
jgi:uncharacterized membrane protein